MKPKSEGLGPKPTDPIDRLNSVLIRVWRKPVRVKSDYAREHAVIVGMAASMQMITTRVQNGNFANSWHITQKGLSWLSEQETK